MTECTVFRSGKKSDTYLYLAEGQDFTDLPESLRKAFGDPVFVMRLELGRDRKLAHADAAVVRAALRREGYFLQLPPGLSIEDEISRKFS